MDIKINDDLAINEILQGMTYCGVSVANVKTKIGRGGTVVSGNAANAPIVLSAVFHKV